ncbi:hypothetical protein BJX99DRAFT_259748 [Aspergillus californicus]
MMDEIEFQLCLSIDPTDVKQDNTTTPRPVIRGKKRSAESFEDEYGDGDDRKDDKNVPSLQQLRSDEQELGDGGYLQLPPRKKVRTSLTFSQSLIERESQGQGHNLSLCQEGCNTKENAVNTAEALDLELDPSLDLKRTPHPGIENTDTPRREASHAFTDTEPDIPDTKSEASTEIDDNADDNVVNLLQISPQAHTQDMIYHRPQPPFVYFPESAFMPALVDNLCSTSRAFQIEAHAHQAHQFIIYEDPDYMDLDVDIDAEIGEDYWFGPAWYLSPEDDKENIDDGHRAHRLGEPGYETRYEIGIEDDREIDRMEAYTASTGITVHQQASSDTTTFFQRHIAEQTVEEAPPEGSIITSPWSEVLGWAASTELETEQTDIHPSTSSTNTHADEHVHTPTITYFYDSENPQPLATLLSATEVSLRALSSHISGTGSLDTGNGTRPRRRRLMRSVHFV